MKNEWQNNYKHWLKMNIFQKIRLTNENNSSHNNRAEFSSVNSKTIYCIWEIVPNKTFIWTKLANVASWYSILCSLAPMWLCFALQYFNGHTMYHGIGNWKYSISHGSYWFAGAALLSTASDYRSFDHFSWTASNSKFPELFRLRKKVCF